MEYMEQIKNEFESLGREIYNTKIQKEEYERKHQQQLKEYLEVQSQIFDLDRKNQAMKQQYEDEIMHLKRQLGKTDMNPDFKRNKTSGYSLPPLSTFASLGSTMRAPSPINGGNLRNTEPNEKQDANSDWIVGYNPSVTRTLSIDLLHDINHNSVVCCVKFSKDGKYIATGCNHSAQIYNANNGEKVQLFQQSAPEGVDLYIRSVCFSPDGKFLATGAEDKTVKIWDIETSQMKNNLTGHELDIYALEYTPNSKLIISGSGDRTVKIWNIEDNSLMHTLCDEKTGPHDGVTSVAISPDGRFAAAGSLDKIVRIWDIETGKLVQLFEGHSDAVYSVSYSPDGRSLISGSLDKMIKIWDVLEKPTKHQTLSGHRDFVLSVAYSPDGNWIVSGSKDRTVHFWDSRTLIAHMILQGHRNSVISVAISEIDGIGNGKFATGSGDYKSRIWEWKTGL